MEKLEQAFEAMIALAASASRRAPRLSAVDPGDATSPGPIALAPQKIPGYHLPTELSAHPPVA